jgi:hypothetical protein
VRWLAEATGIVLLLAAVAVVAEFMRAILYFGTMTRWADDVPSVGVGAGLAWLLCLGLVDVWRLCGAWDRREPFFRGERGWRVGLLVGVVVGAGLLQWRWPLPPSP